MKTVLIIWYCQIFSYQIKFGKLDKAFVIIQVRKQDCVVHTVLCTSCNQCCEVQCCTHVNIVCLLPGFWGTIEGFRPALHILLQLDYCHFCVETTTTMWAVFWFTGIVISTQLTTYISKPDYKRKTATTARKSKCNWQFYHSDSQETLKVGGTVLAMEELTFRRPDR